MYGQTVYVLPFSAFATVARKSFNGKFAAKIISNRVFYVAITDSGIGSLKSLHILLDRYLYHMLVKFEQNRMVGNIQTFEVLGKNG